MRMATVYAPMPKKPMWPTDSSPVKPTTRFRLTARIAQMAKTVPRVMANPTPCHMANTTAHVMTIRFAHSSMLPLASAQDRPRLARQSRHCGQLCLIPWSLALLPWQEALGPERQKEDEDDE